MRHAEEALFQESAEQLLHYAHRVGHQIFTRFPPLDAQNDPVGIRLWRFLYVVKS